MLILSRKPGEKILIGDRVEVTVVRITPGSSASGIEAPADWPIVRKELTEKAERGTAEDGGPQAGTLPQAQ